jgi:hypothetical protein
LLVGIEDAGEAISLFLYLPMADSQFSGVCPARSTLSWFATVNRSVNPRTADIRAPEYSTMLISEVLFLERMAVLGAVFVIWRSSHEEYPRLYWL